MDSCALFVNSGSRSGARSFDEARRTLEQGGLCLEEASAEKRLDSLSKNVADAVTRGIPLIVVGGGDGTFSHVARHFVNTKCVLGVLPLGTGNAFARDLEIETDVRKACQVILKGRTDSVDLGFAGNDYFVNVATVGLTTRIAQGLNDDAKKILGPAVYVVALARALLRTKPFHVSIAMTEGRLEFDTLQVVIGNGRYHAGPFPLAPDASIRDGRLTVYGLATTRRSAFVKFALRLRSGTHVDLPEVKWMYTRGGRLEATPSRKVTVDGEIGFSTPIDFRVAPSAIRVRVPAFA